MSHRVTEQRGLFTHPGEPLRTRPVLLVFILREYDFRTRVRMCARPRMRARPDVTIVIAVCTLLNDK